MKSNKLRVGIIGASPNGGWGSTVHIPALQSLPNFEITAVSTSRQESANETSKRFGIRYAFTDPLELSNHPDVDIVTITVKVPDHDMLVRAALNAGKHVYCEWPLGRTTKEANNLLQLAEEKKVRHIVGLQARANPAVNYVKDLISNGYVGKVLSVNVSYSSSAFPTVGETNASIDKAHAYLLDANNGADQLTITAGHMLDAITYMLGQFSEISAIMETQFKQVKVVETGELIQSNATDHVVVNGILENNAIVSTHIRTTNNTGLTMEINGTKGDLRLITKDKMHFQMDPFIVKGAQGRSKDFEKLVIPARYHLVSPDLNSSPAFNVAQLYVQFYKDLLDNSHDTPDFNTGVKVHNLLDTIRKAAETGVRQKV